MGATTPIMPQWCVHDGDRDHLPPVDTYGRRSAPDERQGQSPGDLHHTCTTTEWHLRSGTVTIGHSEMIVELPKYTRVLFTPSVDPTSAS